MIRFQADADLQQGIVEAVRLREPAIDFAAANEGGVIGLPDPEVLELSARAGRILVTHDRRTMPGHFRRLLEQGKASPGVFIVSQFESIGPVAEVLIQVRTASESTEWRNQIRHLPSLSRHVFR